jgi:hypothetical protein
MRIIYLMLMCMNYTEWSVAIGLWEAIWHGCRVPREQTHAGGAASCGASGHACRSLGNKEKTREVWSPFARFGLERIV